MKRTLQGKGLFLMQLQAFMRSIPKHSSHLFFFQSFFVNYIHSPLLLPCSLPVYVCLCLCVSVLQNANGSQTETSKSEFSPLSVCNSEDHTQVFRPNSQSLYQMSHPTGHTHLFPFLLFFYSVMYCCWLSVRQLIS